MCRCSYTTSFLISTAPQLSAEFTTGNALDLVFSQSSRGYNASDPDTPLLINQLNPNDIAGWLTAGYDSSDVLQFLKCVHAGVAHPGTLVDLKMPSQPAIKVALDDAARRAELSLIDDVAGNLRLYWPFASGVSCHQQLHTVSTQSCHRATRGKTSQADTWAHTATTAHVWLCVHAESVAALRVGWLLYKLKIPFDYM